MFYLKGKKSKLIIIIVGKVISVIEVISASKNYYLMEIIKQFIVEVVNIPDIVLPKHCILDKWHLWRIPRPTPSIQASITINSWYENTRYTIVHAGNSDSLYLTITPFTRNTICGIQREYHNGSLFSIIPFRSGIRCLTA